ncbi:hypothetical protein GCM10018777_56720 [Streptomyces albogriseolus]|uniref:hypothetical protein n=1 Tax=Streptomyces TaxID=1883 RepID=UPI001675B2C4
MTEQTDQARREQQLVEAHQATIGDLRRAEARVQALEAEVAAARRFAAEMRDFCSPHGVAVDYADRLIEAMDRARDAR